MEKNHQTKSNRAIDCTVKNDNNGWYSRGDEKIRLCICSSNNN